MGKLMKIINGDTVLHLMLNIQWKQLSSSGEIRFYETEFKKKTNFEGNMQLNSSDKLKFSQTGLFK